jgi:hypothetical protein
LFVLAECCNEQGLFQWECWLWYDDNLPRSFLTPIANLLFFKRIPYSEKFNNRNCWKFSRFFLTFNFFLFYILFGGFRWRVRGPILTTTNPNFHFPRFFLGEKIAKFVFVRLKKWRSLLFLFRW